MANIVEEYIQDVDYGFMEYRDDLGLSVRWNSRHKTYYVAVNNKERYYDEAYAKILNIAVETFQGIMVQNGATLDLDMPNVSFQNRKDAQKGRDALALYLYLGMKQWEDSIKPKKYK